MKKTQAPSVSGMDAKMNNLDNLINKAAAKQAAGGFLPKAPSSFGSSGPVKKSSSIILPDEEENTIVDDAPTLPFNMPENDEPFLLTSLITGEKTVEVVVAEGATVPTSKAESTPEPAIGLEMPDMTDFSKMMANPMMPKPKAPMTSLSAAATPSAVPTSPDHSSSIGLDLPSGDDLKKMASNMMMPKPSANLLKTLSTPTSQPLPPLETAPSPPSMPSQPPIMPSPPMTPPKPVTSPTTTANISPSQFFGGATIPSQKPTSSAPTLIKPGLPPMASPTPAPAPAPSIPTPSPVQPPITPPTPAPPPTSPTTTQPKPDAAQMINEFKLKIAGLNKSLLDFEEKNIMGEISDEEYAKKKTGIETLIGRIQKQIDELQTLQ
jgi:hypothetical protein